jgi:adenosylcobinamide-GDP ribazoletransferase
MRVYPVVGAGLGLAAGVAYAVGIAIGLPAVASALISVAAAIALAGAGPERLTAAFAATLAGWTETAPSGGRIGPAGIAGLVVSVGLRVAAVVVLADAWLVIALLVSAAAASRATMPVLASVLDAVPGEGEDQVPRPSRDGALTAAALGIVAVLALIEVWAALVGLAAAALGAAVVAHFARQRMGGQSVVSLGAAQHLAELAFLVAVIAMR